MHVSTNVALERVSFGSGWFEDFSKGDHVRLYAITAGSYRWREIRRTEENQPWVRLRREDDMRFRVEPGRINYAGMLQLDSVGQWRVFVETIDRSALALRTLEKEHSQTLSQYPIRYSGYGRNVFFAHYLRARARTLTDAASELRSTETGEAQR